MSAAPRESVHAEPVWRERSDFIIGAELPEEGCTEQLWARQIDDRLFEVCCIPFFLYDVALGDVVETDDSYSVVRVVEPSGHHVFRAYFDPPFLRRKQIVEHLTVLAALLEWSSESMISIDALDLEHARQIATYLQQREDRGDLVFELGGSDETWGSQGMTGRN